MAQLNNLLVTGDTRLLNRAHADIDGDSATVNSHTVEKDVPADAVFTDTTYTGTGLISVNASTHVISTTATSNTGTVTSVIIKGTSPIVSSSESAITTTGTRTISHATSGVTEGTYKSVTVNATGHVTAGTNPTTLSGYGITDAKIASGVITLGSNTITPLTSSSTLDATKLSGTIPTSCYTDTKNTAGSTDSSSKLFLIGATSQAANPQTYSQDTAYVGTDGHLYSNSKQVVNLSDTQALTNKTYNGYTLASSCAKSYTDSVTSGGTDLITSGGVYTAINGLPKPMVFKGTVGTGGTITTLPTDGSADVGFTYKVITDGTYAGQTAKVGDTFICDEKTSSSNVWAYIPSGDEQDSDTWRNIKVNGTEKIGSAISTGAVDFVNGTNTTVSYATGGKISINSTDTKNTAGSTDTSSKIYLVGATSQAANPQTYSDDEVYATSGSLTTKEVAVGGGSATMRFNSTDNSIEFVFS
jgi:hypothetical protein